MASDSKQPALIRSKQSRRKLLKGMTVGASVVVAAQSTPEKWVKPILDSVITPAHAQTSTCAFITAQVFASYPGDSDSDTNDTGTFLFSGPSQNYSHNWSGDGNSTVMPMVAVTPGVADDFTLTVTTSATADDAGDLNQNVTPNPTNGDLPFNSIEVNQRFFDITLTLTPDNATFCGPAQTINIDFDD